MQGPVARKPSEYVSSYCKTCQPIDLGLQIINMSFESTVDSAKIDAQFALLLSIPTLYEIVAVNMI